LVPAVLSISVTSPEIWLKREVNNVVCCQCAYISSKWFLRADQVFWDFVWTWCHGVTSMTLYILFCTNAAIVQAFELQLTLKSLNTFRFMM
jgi:hypothetical protein